MNDPYETGEGPFAQLLAKHGPDAMLDAVAPAVCPGELPRAAHWWPQPTDRAEVERLKARVKLLTHEEQIEGAGAMAVALVEVLAEIIADTATHQYAAAVLNLIPALKQEVLLAMQTTGRRSH